MKQQLTPIPPHIQIKKCPPGVAKGAVLRPKAWNEDNSATMATPGCRRKRAHLVDSTPRPTY
jgi:hypothetical protein